MSSLSGRGPRERQPHARGLGHHQVILVDVTFAVRVKVINIYIYIYTELIYTLKKVIFHSYVSLLYIYS